MSSTNAPLPAQQPAPAAKRTYQTPILVTFGRVAALTCSASCAGSNDSATTLACVPGARQMNGASDRALKANVVRVGTHPFGIGLYLFDYKPAFREAWGHGRQFGVMADEVEAVKPEAVCVHPDGYKVVDYAVLGVTRSGH